MFAVLSPESSTTSEWSRHSLRRSVEDENEAQTRRPLAQGPQQTHGHAGCLCVLSGHTFSFLEFVFPNYVTWKLSVGTGLKERKGRCVGLVPSLWTVTAPMGD